MSKSTAGTSLEATFLEAVQLLLSCFVLFIILLSSFQHRSYALDLFSDQPACVRGVGLKNSCLYADSPQCVGVLKSFCCGCEETWRARFSYCGVNIPFLDPPLFDPNAPLDLTQNLPGPDLVDNDGNCVSGKECFFDPLQPTACGEVNGYLKQQNIVTVVNRQQSPLTLDLIYRTQAGTLKGSVHVVLASLERREFNIGTLGLETDSYGTVCVMTDAASVGAWFGGITLYKPNERKKAKEQFDFALYYPFANPLKGSSAVLLSTEKRGMNKKFTVANWIRLTDASPGDTLPLNGTLQYFNKAGKLIRETAVTIPDGGRFDYPAHEAIGGISNTAAIGMARFTPTALNPTVSPSYYLTTSRYFYDCIGGTCNNFITAMNLPLRRASNLVTSSGVEAVRDSRSKSINESVLEVSNLSSANHALQISLFNDKGKPLGRAKAKIASNGTSSISLSSLKSFIGKNSVSISGSAQFVPEGVISGRAVYRFDKNKKLLMAYSVPPVSSSGEVQITQFNTTQKQTNLLVIHNTNKFPVGVDLTGLGNPGEVLLHQSLSMKANETKRIALKLPTERIGLVLTQSLRGGALVRGLIVHNIVSRANEYSLVYSAE